MVAKKEKKKVGNLSKWSMWEVKETLSIIITKQLIYNFAQ